MELVSRPSLAGNPSAASGLESGFVVRRGFPMRPVTGRDTEPGDPVHPPSAGRAVEQEPSELSLEVSLYA
jgi:hypothetical protein